MGLKEDKAERSDLLGHSFLVSTALEFASAIKFTSLFIYLLVRDKIIWTTLMLSYSFVPLSIA
jgi:hypothetical protein